MADFIKNGDGWISGRHYRDGETVTLPEAAAKYLIAPHGVDLRRPGQMDTAATAKPAARAARAQAATGDDETKD